ncbi:NmrA domain-containing protein [Mycena venus]|uniref:NmrA domain-containing protein n=1 Tax=Mycena venus TaxID=2733690 RepID=A0A8H6XNI6_9AGAR|nr:NmrA domain-containing protein [Mycena venus]
MTITQVESVPLVAVVGATGVQGGSVIKALTESDKPYRIRGFTRDVTKAAAETLKKQGVEMVTVNLVVENKEAVYKAFSGADYAFEVAEGIMLIDAAKAAGVKGIVWSGLVSVKELSGGKYTKVQQFDGKAVVTAHGRASGVPFATVQAGLYASSFRTNPMMLAKQPDGTYAIPLIVKPTTVIPIIHMENDYGLYVRRALELPAFPDGVDVYTGGENITLGEMARQLSELTGKTVVYKQIPIEEFIKPFLALGLPLHIIEAVVEAFQFWEEFGYCGGQISTASKEGLARLPQTWAEFVKSADWSKALA